MAKKKLKRRTYVVDRQLQYRLVGMFLLSIVLALILFTAGTVLYYWAASMAGDNLFRESIDIRKQVYVSEPNEEGAAVKVPKTKTVFGVKRWEIIVPPILINNLFILIVIAAVGIFYSHRIAGPVFRIGRDIQRVLDGERGVRISLRQSDRFQDLARRVNELLDALEEANSRLDTPE